MTEAQQQLASRLAACARSLFQRGYSFGTAGNLRAKAGDSRVAPYLPPGHPELAGHAREAAKRSPAFLLKNHGPVTARRTIREASAPAGELEEQARLYFPPGKRGDRLTSAQPDLLRGGKAR